MAGLSSLILYREARKMKKWVDLDRQLVEYYDKDLVLLDFIKIKRFMACTRG